MFIRSVAHRITYTSKTRKPTFSMAHVNQDPSLGFLTKFICSSNQVDFTYFPQLGLPKLDEDDPVPQFDEQKKLRITLQTNFIGDMISVTKGLTEVASDVQKDKILTFAKDDLNYLLSLVIRNGITGEETKSIITFEGVYATGLTYFLEASLSHGIQRNTLALIV